MRASKFLDGVESYIAEEDGRIITGTQQDCTPILEDALRRHNEGNHGTSELKHAARFPTSKVEEYMNLAGITFEEFMVNPVHLRRMLSDPDLKKFRIWHGSTH